MNNLITAQGLEKLQNRYDHLWKKERPAMVKNMAEAAARAIARNAEYIYSKKGSGDRPRLKHLKQNQSFEGLPLYNPTSVGFGCWVTFEDENGDDDATGW
jgi:transcription elongation factor GreB